MAVRVSLELAQGVLGLPLLALMLHCGATRGDCAAAPLSLTALAVLTRPADWPLPLPGLEPSGDSREPFAPFSAREICSGLSLPEDI